MRYRVADEGRPHASHFVIVRASGSRLAGSSLHLFAVSEPLGCVVVRPVGPHEQGGPHASLWTGWIGRSSRDRAGCLAIPVPTRPVCGLPPGSGTGGHGRATGFEVTELPGGRLPLLDCASFPCLTGPCHAATQRSTERPIPGLADRDLAFGRFFGPGAWVDGRLTARGISDARRLA
jgi:hypothetical protein